MNGRSTPLSPVSVGGSEWSYPPADTDGPYPKSRGQQQIISPPNSGGFAGAIMNGGGFPPGPRNAGGPSPPPSVGRSSTATDLYARRESTKSQSTRDQDRERDDPNQEFVLGEHYVSLRRFLTATSRDGKPNPPPNKARDKLQRLTGVQFLELSTDVFDELKRREAVGRRPPNAPPNMGPPPYLLPEDTFHPKRNQARQKLASLGPPRFRDLATDVFCELERRYPRFAADDIPRRGTPMSIRGGPPSRTGTPVNGMNGYPPRGPSRARRPSEASSIRSGRGGPGGPMNGGYVPPSPSIPPGDFGRPMAKQFQSNTIVPNKSTMVEEDDDAISSPTSPVNEEDTYGLDGIADRRESKRGGPMGRNAGPSEADKKIIEDYESQVRELREKIDRMEDALKKKDEELSSMADSERSRTTAADDEKRKWEDARIELENRLAEVQDISDSLQKELDHARDEHADETRMLREEMEELQQSSGGSNSNGMNVSGADAELERENQELRMSLRDQQQVTEEVRREAQEFLREMKVLSDQSSSAYERQIELEQTIESLEKEVRDWRNRYARTKTQLRNMRASSLGLTIDQDAGKYVREKGFTEENGLVKDVHVTKFQIAIDELLQRARVENPEKTMDSMKAVVVSVRRITKDIDEFNNSSHDNPGDEALLQQRAKLKSRVSSTANNLITASKNFAHSAGISPVSLLDAAASHLVAAVVELLRTVKIRATPAGELEDDDDGTMTPVDSTGFFSPRTRSRGQSQSQSAISSAISTQESLPAPPASQGLGGQRDSADSSAYSPISSPRESMASKRGVNGSAFNKGGPPGANGYGARQQQQQQQQRQQQQQKDEQVAVLKDYLEDQTAVLVQTIQNLVQLIRSDAAIDQVSEEIDAIAAVVSEVVARTETVPAVGASPTTGPLVERLSSCRQRLQEAGDRGLDLAADGMDMTSREWRMWTQTLPPIAFEIARETKELVQRVDRLLLGQGSGPGGGGGDEQDDFS